MAHYYVVRKKLDRTREVEKVLYYGVPVTGGRVTTMNLAEMVADRCSLSRGDMLAAVCELGSMIMEQLEDGNSVELEGLGDFYLSAGSEGYENPKDCTPHRVKARRVCFRMAPEVRKRMEFIKFERKPW